MAVIRRLKKKPPAYKAPATLISLVTAFVFFIFLGSASGLGSSSGHHPNKENIVGVDALGNMENLNNGNRKMWESDRHIVYGTAWKKGETARLVEEAVTHGFRFIDTACQPRHYNEAGVGEGWSKAAKTLGLGRDEFYLQTKFTPIDGQDPDNVPYDRDAPLNIQVEQSFAKSLENLRTDYLDALVLHSPLRKFDDTMIVWKMFESFVDSGKVKVLGISNCYDINKLKTLYNLARHKPKVLQNRFYSDSNFDTEIRIFCKENDILYQSFWTLTANRRALASNKVREIAKEKGLTPQTLMYAFMMSLGATPLSGTTNNNHMDEDISVMRRVIEEGDIFSKEEQINFAALLGMPRL